MGRCETCKWWDTKTIPKRDKIPAPSGYCPMRKCYRLGSASVKDMPERGDDVEDGLTTMTFGSWGLGSVQICTAADFGCAHHEPRGA